MAKQPESKLVKRLQKLIKDEGGCFFKIHGGDNPFQAVGIPDLLCCIYGQFVGIEVKMPGEKLRPMQRVALGEIYRAGGIAAVVETVEQGKNLLSYLVERGEIVEDLLPMCYDRGVCVSFWTGFRDP